MPATLPEITQVSKLLSDLFGRSISVTKGKRAPLEKKTTVVARYANENKSLKVMCVVDLSLAANLGAALVLVPATHAQQLVSTGKLDESVTENVQEVCNIIGTLWDELVMEEFAVVDTPEKDLKSTLRHAESRFDATVAIDGYAGGRMTLLIPKN